MGRRRAATWNMPEDWKVRVDGELQQRKITRQALADAVSVTPGLITRMLTPTAQGGVRSSSVAPRVAEYLGIPLPGMPDDPEIEHLKRTLEEIRMVSPATFAEHVAALDDSLGSLRRVLRKARQSKK